MFEFSALRIVTIPFFDFLPSKVNPPLPLFCFLSMDCSCFWYCFSAASLSFCVRRSLSASFATWRTAAAAIRFWRDASLIASAFLNRSSLALCSARHSRCAACHSRTNANPLRQ